MNKIATQHGKVDGTVAGTLGKSCDPTGGFITRAHPALGGLDEAQREAYVRAYRLAYSRATY